MTENKSYELTINERGQLDIIDHIEGKKRNAICIYNDLGVLPFSSAKAVCDKLNEQNKQIKELEKENEQLKNTVEALTEQLAHGVEFVMGDSDD